MKVLAVVEDLFFTAKINESAKHAGISVEFVKSEKDAIERAKASPALIIIDLNCHSIDPLRLLETLKSDEETKRISLIGYLSHVQTDLKLKAQQAGCDIVMPRSAFSQNLPQILKQHAGAP